VRKQGGKRMLAQPETDLSLSSIYLGSILLHDLKKKKIVFVDDLMYEFLKKDKRRTPEMFFDVLTFLFMLGCIDLYGYKIISK